ncbi:hypothetical protein RJT34_08460 [Clitoria ternatea]|uniref:RRM domain-containing protein n=1 Tax=Clitoria ternatea TaxID=43366 RepID=A0AAN9K4L9_CLITE
MESKPENECRKINSSESVARKKIFVGGLPSGISKEEFSKYFEKFGTITDVVVMENSLTKRPRGFGFVTFESENSVEQVLVQSFHDLNGKRVEVKRIVPKEGNRSNGKGASSQGYFPYGVNHLSPIVTYVPLSWYNNSAYTSNPSLNHMGCYKGNVVPYDPYRNIWYMPMVSNVSPFQQSCSYFCPFHGNNGHIGEY